MGSHQDIVNNIREVLRGERGIDNTADTELDIIVARVRAERDAAIAKAPALLPAQISMNGWEIRYRSDTEEVVCHQARTDGGFIQNWLKISQKGLLIGGFMTTLPLDVVQTAIALYQQHTHV